MAMGKQRPAREASLDVGRDERPAAHPFYTSNNHQYPNSITPEGTALLFCELRPKTGFDILRLPLAAPQGAGGATVSDERLSEATSLVDSPSA
jgi:hypothetical protein